MSLAIRASSWLTTTAPRKSGIRNPKSERSPPFRPGGERGGPRSDFGFRFSDFALEVPFAFLLLHACGLVEVDDAALALREPGEKHLLDDLGQRRGRRLDGA